MFLEMNPNCGVFYPPDAQGSADTILTLDPQASVGLGEREKQRV